MIFIDRLAELDMAEDARAVMAEWEREARARCIHGGACGDPFCPADGRDET